jgi:hypothetical protein
MKLFIFTALLAATIGIVSAQEQPQPKPSLKPPTLESFWGTTKGGELPLEFVLNIIDSAVWVMDDKKIKYPLAKFLLVYRSKDRFEDEESGEIKSRFNTNSVQVRNGKILPDNWRTSLYESIKKEDEILITDIIVRDKKGNFFKAPDLKIIIN